MTVYSSLLGVISAYIHYGEHHRSRCAIAFSHWSPLAHSPVTNSLPVWSQEPKQWLWGDVNACKPSVPQESVEWWVKWQYQNVAEWSNSNQSW